MAVGDGALGMFDASHADDPSVPGTVWRSYSVVDNSPAWGYGAVSIRMAKSTDFGASFVDQGAVLLSQDLAGGFSINFEVSSLAYVSGDTRPWKMTYYQVYNNPNSPGDAWKRYDFTLSWIGLGTATSPLGPWDYTNSKLLAGTTNNQAVGGAPVFASSALVVAEPGLLASGGNTLYMAYQATIADPVGGFLNTIYLDKYTSNGAVRTFCGAVFSYNDVCLMRLYLQRAFPRLATMVNLAAPNLVTQGAVTILYVTPAAADGTYMGMFAFKVLNLDTCTLNRTKFGMPIMEWFYTEGTFFCGASGYSPYSTQCGVIMDRYSTGQTPNFQLVNTFIRIS